MAYFTTSVAVGASWVQKLITDLDAGSGPATFKFYTGTQPAELGALSGNTLLATTTCTDPCGSVTGRTATINAPSADTSADDGGTPTFARGADSNGNAVCDIPVMLASAYDALSDDAKKLAGIVIKLNIATFVAGGPVSWTENIVITDPNG